MNVNQPTECRGFTLLELSIVLVIVGLISAGVMVGSSIIHAAKLQSVIADTRKYATAFKLFKSKYKTPPGDLINASEYWPGCTDQGVINKCNGDGNGLTEWNDNEELRLWEHLSLAGLIEGKYTGQLVGGKAVTGENVPITALDNTTFMFYHTQAYANQGSKAHSLAFGSDNNIKPSGPALIPEDAKVIDAKIDDGLADSGYVQGTNGLQGTSRLSGCVTSNTAPSSYILTNSEKKCRVYFRAE